MKFDFLKLAPEDWKNFGDTYYQTIFEFVRGSLDRIDYCVMVFIDKKVAGFVTCLELSESTVYWQYGGAVPEFQKSIYGFHGLKELQRWFSERYKYISVRVKNSNKVFLRLLLKADFNIVGVLRFGENLLVECQFEREGA